MGVCLQCYHCYTHTSLVYYANVLRVYCDQLEGALAEAREYLPDGELKDRLGEMIANGAEAPEQAGERLGQGGDGEPRGAQVEGDLAV